MAALKDGDQIKVKQLKIGDVVEIWSTTTEFKKFFNLELLEFLVKWNETQKKFIWLGKNK